MSHDAEGSKSTTGTAVAPVAANAKVAEAARILLPVVQEKKDAIKSVKKQIKEVRKSEKKEAKKEAKKIKKQEKKDAKHAEKEAKRAKKEEMKKANADRMAALRQKQKADAQSKDAKMRKAKPDDRRDMEDESNFWGESAPPVKRLELAVDRPGEVFNNLYKTVMCRRYISGQHCAKGKDCVYAHGWSEFKGKVRPSPLPLTDVVQESSETMQVKDEVKHDAVKDEETLLGDSSEIPPQRIKYDGEEVWARFPGAGSTYGLCHRAFLEWDNGDGTLSVRWKNGHNSDKVVSAECVFKVSDFPENPDAILDEVSCIHCFDTGWLSEGEPCYCDVGQQQRDTEVERLKVFKSQAWVRIPLEAPGRYTYQNTYTGETTNELPPILQDEWETRQMEPYGTIYFNKKNEQVHFQAPPIPEDAQEEAEKTAWPPLILQSVQEETEESARPNAELEDTGEVEEVPLAHSAGARFSQQWRDHVRIRAENSADPVMDNASAIRFFEAIHAKVLAHDALTSEAVAEQIEHEVLRAKARIPADMLQVMLEEIATIRSGS